MNFVIATPFYESAKPWYCDSLAKTFAAYPHTDYVYVHHTYLPIAREMLVEIAQESMVDGILMVDADMEWKPSDVANVVGKDHIVCGCYPSRSEPDVMVKNGFGFVWLPIETFDGPKPHFFVAHMFDGKSKWIGEDIYFWNKIHGENRRVELYYSNTLKHAFEPGPRAVNEAMAEVMR